MQKRTTDPQVTWSAPRTISEAIEINAAKSPQAPAIIFPNRAILTYDGLLQHVMQIKQELRRVGIGPRKRVAVALSDGPDLALMIAAIACCATVVPLNPKLTRAEIEGLFVEGRLDALVITDDTVLPVQEIAIRHNASVLAVSRRADGVGLVLRASGRECPAEDVAVGPDDTAIILRTSGTTGRPKLIFATHQNFIARAERLQSWCDLMSGDRVLCVAPLYYSQGLHALFVSLILGASIAFPSRSSGSNFFSWLDEFKPTWYSAGPTFHRTVLDSAPSIGGPRFSHSLRFIFSAAAALPDSIHVGLESLFGVPVLSSYGLSESGVVAANAIPPVHRKRGTVGKFRRGELALRNEKGIVSDAEGTGEIVLRGPNLTPGYIDDPEANRDAFTEGWFRTGDLGQIDKDGFLAICGRLKEIINRGGEKIMPAEIDDVLLRHPDVAEAAAFPISHPRLGEDVAAVVVLRPGSTLTSQQLREFLKATLSSFKIPRKIYFVAELQKGEAGKVRRQELSRLFGESPVECSEVHWNSALEIEIAAIWQQILGRENIGPEDDFFDLGGDSLLATRMLLELERLTDKILPDTMLFENATLRHLAENVVENNAVEHQGLLLKLQSGTCATPFIFVDGDFSGGGYYVRNLARLIGPERPVYALRSHALLGGFIPSIKKMAQDYKQILERAGIRGPISLGGHCHGALIAFELATQFEAAGGTVELVALVEPFSLNARLRVGLVACALEIVLSLIMRDAEKRQARLSVAMSWIWSQLRKPFRQRPRSLLRSAVCKAKRLLSDRRRASMTHHSFDTLANAAEGKNRSFAEREAYLLKVYHQRMACYVPKSISSRLLCFVSEANFRSREYAPDPWRDHSRNCEISMLPGGHLTCITTHVEVLANCLRERLARSDNAIEFVENSNTLIRNLSVPIRSEQKAL